MRVLARFRVTVLIAVATLLLAPKLQQGVLGADAYVVNLLADEMSTEVELLYTVELPRLPDGLPQSTIVTVIEAMAKDEIESGFGCDEIYEASNLALVECLAEFADPSTLTQTTPVLDPCGSYVRSSPEAALSSVINEDNAETSLDGDIASTESSDAITNDDGSHGAPPDDECPHATCLLSGHDQAGNPICLAWVSLCPLDTSDPAAQEYVQIAVVQIPGTTETMFIIEGPSCPPADNCEPSDSQVELVEDLLARLEGYGYGSAADGGPCGNTQPEQYREGAGSQSENPVLVAEGVKTDRASDLYVPLRGTDFELTRHYNAGALIRSEQFPWMVGAGWGLSTDGWIGVTEDADLGDMISITTYPLETSERYLGEPGQTTGIFEPMGPSTSLVRTTTNTMLVLYEPDDEDVDSLGTIKSRFSVFVYDDPGSGQVTFFNTDGNELYDYLHGRVAQRRDAYGNVWTYRYVRHTDDQNNLTAPRLLAVYLNHNIIGPGADQSSDARVVFTWDTGDSTSPGTGMVTSVEAQRPGSGSSWHPVQRVNYTYSHDDGEDIDGEGGGETFSSDLVRSGVTDSRLVLVEREELVDAPLTTDLSWPDPGVWHKTYSMYRYGGVDGRMSHEFTSRELEFFAENQTAGLTVNNVLNVCAWLLTQDNASTTSLLGETIDVEDLASKIIEYWEIPVDTEGDPLFVDTDLAADAPGFPWGALEGRVKSEILQSACGCGGGGASQDRKIDFAYARKDILDFVTGVELTIVDLLGGNQTVVTDIPHPRNMSLTVQTESVKDGSTWVPYKRVSQWSYDEVYRLRAAYVTGGLGYRFRVIPVPFTILNRVEEYTGSESGDDPEGRVWWSYMDFENHMLARTFPTTAVQEVELDTNDLIEYDPDISSTSSESDPGIAVDIRGGSMFVYSEYDEFGRITEKGVAKVATAATADDLTVVEYPSQTTSYVYSSGASDRLDLVAEIRTYPTAPDLSQDAIQDSNHYSTAGHEATESDFLEEPVTGLLRDRVTRIGTIRDRESTAQNGPGGQVSSWVGFDQYGQAIWTADAVGRINTTSYDTLTGAAIEATRNADPANAIPSGQMPDPAYIADWPSYGSSEPTATTTAKVDVHGRTRLRVSETGLVTATDFRLAQIPVYLGEPTDPDVLPSTWPSSNLDSYLQVTTLPPPAGTGFAGPATRQWVDAAYNVIQSSTYAISGVTWDGTAWDSLPNTVSLGNEYSRTAHVYGLAGNLREKLTWHDLDNATTPGGPAPGVYSERFSYDAYGRVVQALAANGQLTLTGYDVKDRVVSQWAGSVPESSVGSFPFSALDASHVTASNGVQSDGAVDVQLLSRTAYDVDQFSTGQFPQSGIGDGVASATRAYISHSSPVQFRDTRTIFDWRNRARLSYTVDRSTGNWEDAFPDTTLSVSELDNLGRSTKAIDFSPGELVALGGTLWDDLRTDLEEDSLDTTLLTSAAVIARSETLYGPRGLVYRARSALDPNSTTTNWSESNTFYDAKGRVLASVGADGPITKPTFDGLGRSTRTITTSGVEARGTSVAFSTAVESDPAFVGAPVLSISTTEYDPSTGNGLLPVRTTTQQRAHDATGDGIGANPITTYSTTGYDSANRPVWAASYGTNATGYDSGGSVPGLSQPTRSVNVVVTETEYDEIGRAHITTDNKDRKYRSYYDALGRVVASVDNYVQPTSGDLDVVWDSSKGHYVVSGRDDKDPETGSDKNRVTSMVYDGAGNIVRRVAHLLNSDPSEEEKHQVTEFVYDFEDYPTGTGLGVLPSNRLTSNGFLYAIRYPDPSTGQPGDAAADIVRFALNLAGEQVERVDQNGTSLAQTRDGLGRIERETATIAALSHLRDEVNVIETTYDSFGRVEKITSLNDDGSTETVVNELKNEFDNRGRLTRFYQSPHGQVDTQTTDFTEHTFVDVDRSGNWTSRLDAVKYPTESHSLPGSGRTSIEYVHDTTTLDDELGRLSGIRWAGELPNQSTATRGVFHTYLGTSRRVKSVFGDFDGLPTAQPKLVRDRTIDETGASSAGTYPALDPLGRVSHHIWSIGDHDPTSRPALFNLEYEYDQTSNIVARLDSRKGSQSDIRHTTYAFDEIDRLVQTVRSANPSATGVKGSQDWVLDANGNWINRVRQLGGSDTEDEDRAFDATNEITLLGVVTTVSGVPGPEVSREYQYDNAGNLTLQQLANDVANVPNRRLYQYDAWNRLVAVSRQVYDDSPPPPATPGWQDPNFVTSYSYFGNNYRASRNADDDVSTGNTPVIRTRFFYDNDWMLLEERTADVSADSAATWHWDGTGNFSSGTTDAVTQYIWDATAQDELVAVQVGELNSSDWVFDERWWALTDRNHNLVGMIREVWDANLGAFRLQTEGLERIRYRPYGFAEQQWLADTNGDGAVDMADLNRVMGSFGATMNDAGYAAEIDTDASGVIDLPDQNAVFAKFGEFAPTDGSLWDAAPGMIGFGAGLYDEVAGLYLFRHRYYDPYEGRWITRDPAGYVDGMNLYQYVQGNPLMYFDPFGLMASSEDFSRSIFRTYETSWGESEFYVENSKVYSRTPVYDTGPRLWFGTQRELKGYKTVSYPGMDHTDVYKGQLTQAAKRQALHDQSSKYVQLIDEAQNQLAGEATATALTAGVAPIASRVGKSGARAVGELVDAAVDAKAARGIKLGDDIPIGDDGIPRINGYRPQNYGYAGKNYCLKGDLASKYPDGVDFTGQGFPIFDPYAKSSVKFDDPTVLTGGRGDFAAANKAAGFERTPRGYTWHHAEDGLTMQLVPTDLHRAVNHTGGVAVIKHRRNQR